MQIIHAYIRAALSHDFTLNPPTPCPSRRPRYATEGPLTPPLPAPPAASPLPLAVARAGTRKSGGWRGRRRRGKSACEGLLRRGGPASWGHGISTVGAGGSRRRRHGWPDLPPASPDPVFPRPDPSTGGEGVGRRSWICCQAQQRRLCSCGPAVQRGRQRVRPGGERGGRAGGRARRGAAQLGVPPHGRRKMCGR